MPLIGKWKRTPLVWQLTVLLSVCIVIIGGLIIAIVALSTAQSSGREAKSAVACVNHVLGDRNGASSKDAIAHEQFADALQRVLLAPKPDQAAAYKVFLGELNHYIAVLQADQKYRDTHPLGKC